MENLLNCHGRRFRAVVDGTKTQGKITVEDGVVYLCQDVANGQNCSDKQGYKYSWQVRGGSAPDLTYCDVEDFHLMILDTSTYKDWQVGDRVAKRDTLWEVIFRSGELVVLKTSYGKASENYTCNELFERGWRLVVETENIVELTLEDVAKMKGVSVDRIRIMEK